MASTKYNLTIKTTGPQYSMRYHGVLKNEAGFMVADDFFDTVWGARWWGRRKAKKHMRARRTFEFEVKAR